MSVRGFSGPRWIGYAALAWVGLGGRSEPDSSIGLVLETVLGLQNTEHSMMDHTAFNALSQSTATIPLTGQPCGHRRNKQKTVKTQRITVYQKPTPNAWYSERGFGVPWFMQGFWYTPIFFFYCELSILQLIFSGFS